MPELARASASWLRRDYDRQGPAGSVAGVQPAVTSWSPRAGSRGLAYLAGTGALVIAAAACSSSSSSPPASPSVQGTPGATFDDQGGQPQACMNHQRMQPTSAYRAGTTAVSELELPMLAYYTANGNKAYCDARPPTATDRSWLTLYVRDGAEPVHVQRYLHSP